MKQEELFTVNKIALMLKVSEETVRRWIRSKELRAIRRGNEFLISRWNLETFHFTGGSPTYDNPFLLLHASQGLHKATNGALLFDDSYFKVEKQWERINEDRTLEDATLSKNREQMKQDHEQLENWLEEMKKAKTLGEMHKLSQQKPSIPRINNEWSIYQRMFFMDIHFYFVAAEGLNNAITKLEDDLNDNDLTIIIKKYRLILKDFQKIRGMMEHLDKQMTNPKLSGDLGNFDDSGFSFGRKYYDFKIEEIRKLRNELCDYLLSKTLPKS